MLLGMLQLTQTLLCCKMAETPSFYFKIQQNGKASNLNLHEKMKTEYSKLARDGELVLCRGCVSYCFVYTCMLSENSDNMILC